MTFHHRRIDATRKVKFFRGEICKARRAHLIKDGALTINLWNTMPPTEVGTVADDWKAVGADMRQALSQYADECG